MAAMEEARRRARRLELPHDRVASEIARGGRIGDDYDADNRLLLLARYNKERLICFLRDSVLEHRWFEAAGICSTLLRSLSVWSKSGDTRQLFTTAMEILRQLEPGKDNRIKYRKLFNIMYNAQQGKKLKAKRIQGEVDLHLAIHLLSIRDIEGAYNVLRTIADGLAFHDDPAVNLTYGRVLHYLWYKQVCEEIGESSEGEGSFGDWKPETHEIEDNKVVISPMVYNVEGASEALSNPNSIDVTVDSTLKPEERKKKVLEVNEDDDFWANAQVHVQPIMDKRLFPVHIPYERPNVVYSVPLTSRSKDFRDKAVEHLQRALSAAPELIPALIPLVQLFLAAGDVEGASKALDICYQATKHVIPLSLKSLLLESLSEQDTDRMAQCYEEIIHRNPSSIDAITGLITLHENGAYATESLMGSIAAHLDVATGSARVWRKLADCFLEISLLIKNDGRDVSSEDLVSTFFDRSLLWKNKHFPENLIAEDKIGHRWKVVTYKAASASHIHGPSFGFVTRASHILKALNKKRYLALLTQHREQSLCLLAV